MPEADLARRRADIRRSLLRVGAAGLVVVLVVVGLAIAAVLAAFRSQDNARRAQAATTRAEEELRNSYVAQSWAGRLSAVMGSKEAGLTAIAAAARIRPDVQARTEAIAHLALLDLSDEGLPWQQRGSGQLVQFDTLGKRFAISAGRRVDGRRVAYANAQGWGLWEVRRPPVIARCSLPPGSDCRFLQSVSHFTRAVRRAGCPAPRQARRPLLLVHDASAACNERSSSATWAGSSSVCAISSRSNAR